MTVCRCGCGTELPEGQIYVRFHHLNAARKVPRHKKRKYKKRDRKYWGHKKTDTKITSYTFPLYKKDIEQLDKHFENIRTQFENAFIQIAETKRGLEELQVEVDGLRNIISMKQESIDASKNLFLGEHQVKMRFAGIE